ncbi:hypothetical protein DPMN_110196 [Dreissena polymorpha]|uniref:Uncharacterized protein n=1 Tax=Dreissena polymorpha TaxID=45954 RepID=A0A9D4QNS3_DREPO|nr:hypothetical protein DPMN_110196 [Dreissena polymorpha]
MSVTNGNRSPSDQRPTFLRSSGWRPADDRTETGPICSIGRRIELISKQDRTINARVSPGDRPTSVSLNVCRQKKRYFPEAYTSAGDRLIAGGPPLDARRTPDDARYETRTMNPMSGARQAITVR